MTNQALDLFKLLLLGLLYAFFARVLWAVWTEVREPAGVARGTFETIDPSPAAPIPTGRRRRAIRKGRGGVPARLVVLEPTDRRGVSVEIGSGIRIGREPDNTVVIPDDPYVSGYHAKVSPYDNGVVINDLASRNGTLLNGSRVTDQRIVHPGDRIQIGTTVLEAR